MNIRRYTDGTPCPAPPNPSFPNIDRYYQHAYQPSAYATSTTSYLQDDTTTALEYTTELQNSFRNAKPRRRPRDAARKSTFNPSMDIFEDVALEEQQQQNAPEVSRRSRTSLLPKEGNARRSTILAQPAQKIPVAAPPVKKEPPPQTVRPTARRRVSSILADRAGEEAENTVLMQKDAVRERRKSEIKKNPRRRTIYVPSDGTTMITIHPGAPTHKHKEGRVKSPNFGLELVTLSEEEPENLVPALKQDKKTSRQSLAVPPKRGPLQHTSRPLQTVSFSEDLAGKGGGKENMPPGCFSIDEKKATKKERQFNFSKAGSGDGALKPARVHFASSKAPEPVPVSRVKVEGSRKRVNSEIGHSGSPAKSHKIRADGVSAPTAARKATSRRISKALPLASSSPFQPKNSPPSALRRARPERPPSKLSVPKVAHERRVRPEKYPVLSEDLCRPELYEDHWLNYQEVAITQLLNSFFDSVNKGVNLDLDPDDLRKALIKIYHEPAVPLLHKRIQASLLYGALSVPKDLLAQTLRIKDDVGLRRKFLNLWVETYDLTALRCAAETVVGRKIPVSSRLSGGSMSSDCGERQLRAERRAIDGFLDTFLIRNEDAVRVKTGVGTIARIARGGEHHGDDFGTQGWSWRRTVLRSLMLIMLLDKAKTTDILPGCLFQLSSPHKTSATVLQSLSTMLLPSVGDVTRPLGHLNYRVKHAQYPLQEYTYHVGNLATDLRDGVLLTRLVELLLYPPSSLAAQRDETVTITMPTGELLTSNFDLNPKETWVLSQHLKFPSLARAQKLYNAQIALSALDGIRGIPHRAISDVRPEDIVDGHREKTLSLLWALVGKWGLGALVNWSDVEKEIATFRRAWYEQHPDPESDLYSSDEDTTSLEGLAHYKYLLKSWAFSIARLHGLRVSNLTTSFADGRVFEAIMDAYLPTNINTSTSMSKSTNRNGSLAPKLKAAGCSTAFVSLFTPSSKFATPIPSKDFTLQTLAFLASRLPPLARAHRAAVTIQRCFRLFLVRRTSRRRVTLMRLALECAKVVRTRERVVNAATVLQRGWRKVLDQRQERLRNDITAFQARARGWAVRRALRGALAGKTGWGKIKERRARGGW
ncbi:hypothetical protein BU16DRAFT_501170 [Lophium mytilinum]|uniref:Calponin-homology (CH) domain-containing protein n=1 Tax=Lophium mytilinum TaxID=390894 RepID=A0A6A6RAS2_9PEZI|nr:hypothetical protein BU16DRAFT_501170 [Lophium mytilinum]